MAVDFFDGFNVGCSHEKHAGEEYQIGKYVLEDLEFGSQEETGCSFYSLLALIIFSFPVTPLPSR